MSIEWTKAPETNSTTLEERKTANNAFVLSPCGLSFIDDHFGPRPGCFHTLMGSLGRGKSTLVQSLILKWVEGQRILLYLSEEGEERVELKLYEKEKDLTNVGLNLRIVHEREFDQVKSENYSELLKQLEIKILHWKPKLFIMDNLTTSRFYDMQFRTGGMFLSGLRTLAEQNKMPIFLVAHTKKGVNETKGIMLPDDVRGSATLANTSDYFYTFYRVHKTSDLGMPREGVFVYVNKCRDHENQDSIYRVDYDVNKKRYVSDTKINFKAFKEFMRERDRL